MKVQVLANFIAEWTISKNKFTLNDVEHDLDTWVLHVNNASN